MGAVVFECMQRAVGITPKRDLLAQPTQRDGLLGDEIGRTNWIPEVFQAYGQQRLSRIDGGGSGLDRNSFHRVLLRAESVSIGQARHQRLETLLRPVLAINVRGTRTVQAGHHVGQSLNTGGECAFNGIAQQVFKNGGQAPTGLIRHQVAFGLHRGSPAVKKKERRQFDTSTKRGIRKQAREDIRILKFESRQLKKEQNAARKSAKRQAKLEKQQIKQQLSEERKKERTANKASNQPPASGKSKKKKRKEITLEDYLPIDKIANGVIYTTDHRYVKILEIEPINFLLRSAREQQGIIFSFISYLKISPVKLQIKMISKKADINKHLEQSRLEMERESDPNCRQLQKDYIQFVRQLSSREAVSRRFFLIFEYEPFNVNRKVEEKEILAALETAAQTAKTFLYQCGNDVLVHDNEDEFTTDVLYTLLNRTKCTETPLPKRINQVLTRYMESGRE